MDEHFTSEKETVKAAQQIYFGGGPYLLVLFSPCWNKRAPESIVPITGIYKRRENHPVIPKSCNLLIKKGIKSKFITELNAKEGMIDNKKK